MTDESRKQQIQKALASRRDQPEAERHTHPLRWHETDRYFPVIELPVEVPLLWADSHRIRAELEAPQFDYVRREKTTDQAQAALAELWKRAHRKFDKLKESLQVEGQTEPGVVTREGVLINGNTRLVALRELGRDWIRVAVLDSDARPFELADLELRLQVRETGHDTYRLSNELLFIHELEVEYGKADEDIAKALNWNPSKPAIGRQKVELHRRLLQLVREMQRRDVRLPITFFDDEGPGSGKLQQLKELELSYSEAVRSGDMGAANLLLDTWLVVARSGFSSVHQIRAVTQRDDFVAGFLVPRLSEQPIFGERADELVHELAPDEADLPGWSDLGPGEDSPYDLSALVNLVESPDDSRVQLFNDDDRPVEAVRVKAAIQTAVAGALRDHRAEDRVEGALSAPVDALRKAGRELKKALDSYAELRGTKDFERQVRGPVEYQLRHIRRSLKLLEDLVADKDAGPRR